ncbi:MAG: DUF1064 domain-containing protein [Chloroflexi bacterium]|nr:DUF1064 domain-containing protein [Chloroflexota bacterium]
MARLTARDIRRLSPETRKQIRQALRSQVPHDEQEGHSIGDQPMPSKYRNIRTTVDGITFASQREANRYAELVIELKAGEIEELVLQKPFSLDVNGVHVCDYIADFVYRRKGAQIVEDAKGKRLELFRIKKLLMKAVLGIEVVEV